MIEFVQDDHGVGIVTLAGNDRSGFLETNGILDLAEVLCKAATDTGLRVLVIRGNEGMFCRGRVGKKGLTQASEVATDLNAILKVNAALDALAVPVITALEGEAFGFGFGLAAQSDYAIAGEGTLLSLPEMSHGIPPLIVLSYLFRFVPYKRAIELALSSRQIGPTEAKEIGIVTEVVPQGHAVARALAVANELLAFEPKALSLLRHYARHAAAAHSPHLSDYAVSTMSVFIAEHAQAKIAAR